MGRFYVRVDMVTRRKAADVGGFIADLLCELAKGPVYKGKRGMGAHVAAVGQLEDAGIIEYDRRGQYFRLLRSSEWGCERAAPAASSGASC